MKGKLKYPVLVICAILIVSTFSVAGSSSGEAAGTEIVMVSLDGEDDLNSIRSAGGEILQRYPNRALVELPEDEIDSTGLQVRSTLPRRTEISVSGYRFDIEDGEPDLPEVTTIEGYEEGEKGQYIVHMLGPISSGWREEIEDDGVEVMNYIHNHAYRVRMTPETADDVEDLDFVDWIGVYHPEYKIQPDLEPGTVNIRLVEGTGRETIEEIVETVPVISSVELDRGFTIKAEVDSLETIHDLASITDVSYISEDVEYRLHDEMATQIIGGGTWFYPEDWETGDNAYRDPDLPGDYAGEAGSYMNQLGYTGEGVTIAIADTGLGDGTTPDAGHDDFTGRVVGGHTFGSGSWDDGHGHGTHCTGSAAGDTYMGSGQGYGFDDYYAAQGSAPESEIYAVQIFENGGSVIPSDLHQIFEVAAQDSDTYVHSNSWGSTGGHGTYTEQSTVFDAAVRDSNRDTDHNEPMVITTAAGNDGDTGVPPPASAKNIITVGATENYNSETDNPEYMADFSSRGFVDDNRVKPDVVAPGSNIYSTMPGNSYDYMSGTSMANPAAAGAGAVVVDWYEENYGVEPSPAMVRSLMINTANQIDGDTEGPIPNGDEGWGMVDISKLERPHDDPISFLLEDQETLLEAGEVDEHTVGVDDQDEPLKVTLTWTDKEAPEGTGSGDALLNDLNLEVISPNGDVYKGNAFENGWTQPGTDAMDVFDDSGDGWDDTNNVENVYIHPDELESGAYTINVEGFDIPEDANNDGDNNQDYALAVYNAAEGPHIEIESPLGGEYWETGQDEDILWDTEEGGGTITDVDLEYSVDGGVSWDHIVEGQDDTGSYTWTIPDEPTDEAMVRATVHDDTGAEGQDKSGEFTITDVTPPEVTLTSPIGGEEWNAGDNEEITWDSQEGDEPIVDVDLEYSTDDGQNWDVIAEDEDDTGSYTWTIPDVTSPDSLVRVWVHCDGDTSAADMSVDHFDLVGFPPDPPTDLDVEHYGRNESWEWLYEEPHRSEPADGRGITGQGTFYGAMRKEVQAYEITDLAYYAFDEADHVKGYVHEDGEGGESPGELLGETDQVSDPGPHEWIEIEFTEPVSIDGGHYWIVLEVADPGEDERPFGSHEGTVEDNEWISLDGVTWDRLSDHDLIYNWAFEILVGRHDETGDEHNQITWDASADDPEDLSHYNLYRSEDQTGPWDESTLIEEIEGVGSDDYSYLDEDKGEADSIYWWYLVRGVGPDGVEDDNDNAVQEPGDEYLEVTVTDHDDQVYEGETVSVEYLVENVGPVQGMQDIVFSVDGVEEDVYADLTLGPGDTHTGEFTWEAEGEGDHDLEVKSDDDSETVTVEVEERPDEPYFNVIITSHDEEVEEGEEVTVGYTVENIGGEQDTQDIVFSIDGMEEDVHEDITLAPEEAHTGEFTWETESGDAGTYDLEVSSEDAHDTGTITVLVPRYDLTINVEGQGTTEPAEGIHTYEEGEEVTVTAAAAQGWFFSTWTGDHESTEKEITITMDSDQEITAHFEELLDHLLTISVEGEGSTDPDEGTHTYEDGEEVTVTAIPAEGWYFDEWTGIDETGSEITFTIEEDKEITAGFEELDEYDLTIDIEGEGITEPEEGTHTYHEGEEITVTVEPEEGWYFEEWTGDHTGTDEEITVTMNEDKEITAVFEAEHRELTINIEGEGTTDPEEGTHEYGHGEEVPVTATPAEDWYFDHWTGDQTGTDEEITVTMDEDKEITAVFDTDQVTYELTINIEGEGTTDPEEGTHEYDHGEEETVTATPAEDWYFEEWTGDHTGTSDTIPITMDEDKEITAHFDTDEETYDLVIEVEGEGTTDPEEGMHPYIEDREVTVTAEPDENWEFVEWTGDHVSTEEEITVTMDEDKEITAHFEYEGTQDTAYFEVEIVEYDDEVEEGETITIIFNVTNTGEVEGSQFIALYIDGDQVEVYDEVELGPGEHYQGEFILDADDIEDGVHKFEVRSDDEASDGINVDVLMEDDDTSFVSDYWWLILLLLIGVIAAVAVLFMMSRKEEEEEPPLNQPPPPPEQGWKEQNSPEQGWKEQNRDTEEEQVNSPRSKVPKQ